MTKLEQIARGFLEQLYTRGDLSYIDTNCDSAFLAHDPVTGDVDRAGQKKNVQMWRLAFPDLQISVQDIFSSGEKVVARWSARGSHEGDLMGIVGTGKKAVIKGVTISIFRGDKVVETFTEWDTYGMLHQLGIIQPMDKMAKAQRPAARPSV